MSSTASSHTALDSLFHTADTGASAFGAHAASGAVGIMGETLSDSGPSAHLDAGVGVMGQTLDGTLANETPVGVMGDALANPSPGLMDAVRATIGDEYTEQMQNMFDALRADTHLGQAAADTADILANPATVFDSSSVFDISPGYAADQVLTQTQADMSAQLGQTANAAFATSFDTAEHDAGAAAVQSATFNTAAGETGLWWSNGDAFSVQGMQNEPSGNIHFLEAAPDDILTGQLETDEDSAPGSHKSAHTMQVDDIMMSSLHLFGFAQPEEHHDAAVSDADQTASHDTTHESSSSDNHESAYDASADC